MIGRWALFYFPPSKKCPIFLEFAWNWSSVLTGYNDEWFFHVCVSFGLSPGFKLNMETQKVATLFSAQALTVDFISKLWRLSKFWHTFPLISPHWMKPWVNYPYLFISFNTLFFTSMLFSSVCPWYLSLSLDSWVFCCFQPMFS